MSYRREMLGSALIYLAFKVLFFQLFANHAYKKHQLQKLNSSDRFRRLQKWFSSSSNEILFSKVCKDSSIDSVTVLPDATDRCRLDRAEPASFSLISLLLYHIQVLGRTLLPKTPQQYTQLFYYNMAALSCPRCRPSCHIWSPRCCAKPSC